ncbi:MAG: glycosyltransferase family 39 protein [Immundisolibacter sp.]|uniref:ArnT family glycosyltransferase n=1 Tax=Immundisolibacter sp. TaxID=1934948 RepID=UPI00199DA2D1|nr:glycosyltransferase family 39 protein [Immundisolibacter sp.]MBC7162531.1 glycosyltransferase family 39 protein [Immundisolibacter sp.]
MVTDPGWRTAAIALLLAALSCLWQLGALPISRSQELRVAETAREMLASGDYLTPRFNGELRFQKPPLAYWLTAASYRLLGRVDEFSARLPAALAAIGVMLLVTAWTRRQFGEPAALGALAVLASSHITLRFFHTGETDPLLLLFVSLGAFAAWAAIREARPAPGSRAVLWAAITGGTLAKGLPPAVLPLLAGLVWCGLNRHWTRLRTLIWPPGVALLIIVGGAWYLWLWRHHPEATAAILGREISETYLHGDHPGPPWYYLPRVFLYFAPWSALLPVLAWRYRRWPSDALQGYVLIWLLVTFVVLSLNTNKQIQYALLLAPALAILCGQTLASGLPRPRAWQAAAYGFAALLLAAGGYFAWLLGARYLLAPLLAGVALLWLGRRQAMTGALLLAVVMTGAFRLGEAYGLSRHADTAAQLRAAGQAARGRAPLLALGLREVELAFYAQALVPTVEPGDLAAHLPARGTLYLFAPGERFDPPPGWQAEALLIQPKLSLWRLNRP